MIKILDSFKAHRNKSTIKYLYTSIKENEDE